jgi:hypothetical protein
MIRTSVRVSMSVLQSESRDEAKRLITDVNILQQ